MTHCRAARSYPFYDVQYQRLSMEDLLGEPSPSWLWTGALIQGVTDLDRFGDLLRELYRVYPALRATLVTDGPPGTWHQYVRGCEDLWRGRPPVVAVQHAAAWTDLTAAIREDIERRNPDYRFAAAYGLDEAGELRVAFVFDHMAFDVRSVDLILEYLAKAIAADSGPAPDDGSCRCGANDFADFVERTLATEPAELPEPYEWALDLMRAERSPHAFARLPVTTPMTVLDAGDVTVASTQFSFEAERRHTYTPFAALVTAITLGLEDLCQSPAVFYTPTLNRTTAEMMSIGWFAGTPIMPVRTEPIRAAMDGDRFTDGVRATAEAMTAATRAMRDGQPLTSSLYQALAPAVHNRLPFTDATPDGLPYIILGYVDHVRARLEWKSGDVVVRKEQLPAEAYPVTVVPPGYILIRLHREEKTVWTVEAVYEENRYSGGIMDDLVSSAEGYLRQLLG